MFTTDSTQKGNFSVLKTFEKWHRLKFLTNARPLRPTHFKAGQVWWCMVGENIGHEVDGKVKKIQDYYR